MYLSLAIYLKGNIDIALDEEHRNYKTMMLLDTIIVYGVAEEPSKVLINSADHGDFVYDAIYKVIYEKFYFEYKMCFKFKEPYNSILLCGHVQHGKYKSYMELRCERNYLFEKKFLFIA